MMAVYFDKEAKVFDTAPFGLSAQNKFVPIVQVAPGSFVPIPVPVPTLTISEYFSEYQARQLSLGNGRTVSAAFGSYANVLATEDAATRDALFALRAQNVTAKYLEGEVLVGLRALFPNIVSAGGDPPMVPIGTTTMNDSPADLAVAGMSLHSMRLLAAMLASPDLRTASGEIPTLLEAILDDDIYSSDDKTDKVAFLNRLLADQVAGGSVTPGRAVDDFAADVRKLTGTAGLVQTNVQARNALIVAAMDYYYLKDLSQTTALFTVANGGIHFSYSDIGSGQTK